MSKLNYEEGMIISEPFLKVKLTYKAVCRYREFNGFWQSNFDDDGYSTFSKEYFDRVFRGMEINEITEHEIIQFNK